jgi:hypothetical protein
MSTPDPPPVAPRGLAAILREFATADPRSLGLFRIIFGVFLLVDLYRRLPDYLFFYTNEGMLPNHGALFRPMSAHLFSIYHAFSTRGEVLFAFALTALVYLTYLVGYKTRLCQGLVLLLVTSLHSRNILLENGGDVVANLLALWTFFLPLGRRFSVDALLASFREEREHGPDELQDRERPFVDRRPFVSLAFAAIVFNLAVIYYFNVVHKDGLPWRVGSSVHYVLWTDRLVNPLGVWLRLWVPPFLIQVMTMGTLVIESSIVLLLLSPFFLRSCRRVAAFLIVALHCGFQTVGHYGLFSFVMMLHAVLLLGPEDWDALARRMHQRLPCRILYYDNSCGVCHLLARLLRRLDHLGRSPSAAMMTRRRSPPGSPRRRSSTPSSSPTPLAPGSGAAPPRWPSSSGRFLTGSTWPAGWSCRGSVRSWPRGTTPSLRGATRCPNSWGSGPAVCRGPARSGAWRRRRPCAHRCLAPGRATPGRGW